MNAIICAPYDITLCHELASSALFSIIPLCPFKHLSQDARVVRTTIITLCQDEGDSPRSYEGRSPKNTKQQINKTVLRGRFFRHRPSLALELSKTIDVEAFYILVYNSFWLAQVILRRVASIQVSEIWLLSKSCPKGRIWASSRG